MTGPSPTDTPAMIVAHVPNLFDRSRFAGRVEFVETAEEAASLSPDLVIVDLDRCKDVPAFRLGESDHNGNVTVIGFGPHVETELHRLASEAGYDEILPRSVFFRRLPELLGLPE